MQARTRRMPLFAVIAVALGVVLGGRALAQTDPNLGTWKLNVAKSKYDPEPPPMSETRVFEPWESDGVKFMGIRVLADGTRTYSGILSPLRRERLQGHGQSGLGHCRAEAGGREYHRSHVQKERKGRWKGNICCVEERKDAERYCDVDECQATESEPCDGVRQAVDTPTFLSARG
jgi:hypothetical protein